MKQLKVSLPDDLRGQLDNAAAASGRSLGNEIRERLERSFKEQNIDAPTHELLAGIVRLVGLVKVGLGTEWHSTDRAHGALVAAVLDKLAAYKPWRSAAPGQPVTDLGLSDPKDPPDTIGRTIALLDHQQHPDEHLQAALRNRPALRGRHFLKKKGDHNEQT